MRLAAVILPSLCLFAGALAQPAAAHAQAARNPAATLSGTVTDPSDAVVQNAEVTLHPSSGRGADSTTQSGPDGRYRLANLAVGSYTLRVAAPGFAVFESPEVKIAGSRSQSLDVRLEVASENVHVDVSGDNADETSPDKNGDAIVLSGKAIDALPDNPQTLQQELQAMSGGQSPAIYVDGFSNGTIPPKETIQEIRINQNRFSARNDTDPQDGSIEIITKPGTDKLHGSFLLLGNDSPFNGQNPFAHTRAPYYSTQMQSSLSGPLSRKLSYFLSFARSSYQTDAIIDAQTLDTTAQDQIAVNQVVPTPNTFNWFSSRLDFQPGTKSTVRLQYSYSDNNSDSVGVGQLVLPSQAVNASSTTQSVQATFSHIFSAKVVNDLRFQYTRPRSSQTPHSTEPTLVVQGAFNGGGNSAGASHDSQDNFELQNYIAIQSGKHYLSPGIRLRVFHDASVSQAGYNGAFTFSTLNAYQATVQGLAQGLTPAQIAANGGGAKQFSITTGNPAATLSLVDLGAFYQDDWKIKPHFTLSYGLRYQVQSHLADLGDFAPRIGFAWGFGVRKDKSTRFVLRGGSGLFYKGLGSGTVLQAERQNGIVQQQYVVASPTFFPAIPAPSSLGAQNPPTIYQINPAFRSPYSIASNLAIDHPLGARASITLQYDQYLGIHTLYTRNINAPLPGTYDPANPASGTRPLPGTQNIYEFESGGIFRTNSFSGNVRYSAKNGAFIQGYYQFRLRNSDADGGFVSNGYDIRADYGRAAQDVRQNFYAAAASPTLFGGLVFYTFLNGNSGAPFNITVPQDLNGDSIFNDRPAFATDLTRPSVVATRWGVFDTSPIPGQKIIPINYGQSPAFYTINSQLNWTFHVGPALPAPPGAPRPPASAAPTGKGKPPIARKYSLAFGIQVSNVMNHVNLGPPVGVLGSPLFGRSLGLNATTGNTNDPNRRVKLSFYARF